MPTLQYKTEDRKTAAELAVNLADLDRLRTETRAALLAGKVATDGVVNPTGLARDIAVRFTCDTVEAALLCDLLRSYDRVAGDRPTKVLVRDCPESPWRKVAEEVQLTYVDSTTYLTRLNPKVFPVTPGEIVPLQTGVIEWR